MRAWLFTILRNTYYSQHRRRGREVQDTDGVYSERIAAPPNQEGALDLADFPPLWRSFRPNTVTSC